MEAVTLLRQAEAAGLTVIADGSQLVVRGPKNATPIVEQLGQHKAALLTYLRKRERPSPVPWVLEEWRRLSIPAWRHILEQSIEQGDRGREEYARWMLREVLLDPEYPKGQR
ncbi:MAG: hypothetical protein HY688_03005 [Chloroflexi bacterium]|nr:hypothetical protein [Chloroflexota bacterium]